MEDPARCPKPCCVCYEPGGKHCTECKSQHYCSKACQRVDWYERGHKAQCKQLAAYFQDRLLDELMPAKLKIKEEDRLLDSLTPEKLIINEEAPATIGAVEGAPADGSTAPRVSVIRTTATPEAEAFSVDPDDKPGWSHSICVICFDPLPYGEGSAIYWCCTKTICSDCAKTCEEYDSRCPMCRAPAYPSDAEMLRRLRKHVDEGNADAQLWLGDYYQNGGIGLKKDSKRALQLFALAAAQGHALAQVTLGQFYEHGHGGKVNHKLAVRWFRRAAEQGFPPGQFNLGVAFDQGKGVAQSLDEAVNWYRLAAAEGDAGAQFNLGACYANGHCVPQDQDEALRLFKRAAANGCTAAEAAVRKIKARLASTTHSFG